MHRERRQNYNDSFYSCQVDGSIRSAKDVLAVLYEFYQPRSVIDIGCGRGAWLSIAQSLGSNELKGLDGEWVNKEKLLSKDIDFSAVNFEMDIPLERKYDLCMSVEVAEHLVEDRAQRFVDFLCRTSNVVLFSAAIKYQGGCNHFNEQPQSYWLQLFRKNNFECFDVLRPAIWDNPNVQYWYKQNLFLYVSTNFSEISRGYLKSLEKPMLDVVHPRAFEEKSKALQNIYDHPLRFYVEMIKQYQYQFLRFYGGAIKRYLIGKMRRFSPAQERKNEGGA